MTRHDDGSLWIRRYHPAPVDAPVLLCLPHAGGSASYFFPAAKELSSTVDVLAVQYPGRQDRRAEPGIDSIGELADRLFEALQPLPDAPIFLFGHSMGATVGFELARRLDDAGRTAKHLLVSGRRAPSVHKNDRVHQQDDRALVAEMRRLGGTDSMLLRDEELLQMILPAIRGDYRAIETYRCAPNASVACPITAFVGDADPRTSLDEARAWREHTTSTFDLEIFPGGHFYLESQLPATIDAISRVLTTAMAR
ncbi:alpha/beta fold hydrolase [Micromonospora sp. FIMYZ51]|uniref:thioesterase II family protein n=1 Tax=Micromonospora sp. FIMYZ51 TaxID=3051832 RepID=UPI00311EAB23